MNYYSDPGCLWLVFMFGPGFNVGNDSPASGLIGPWVQAMTVLISHPHLMDGSWVSWRPNPDQVGTEMNENNMVLALCMDIQIHAIMLHLTKINGEKLFEHGQKKEVDIWKGCQTCLIALHVPSAHTLGISSVVPYLILASISVTCIVWLELVDLNLYLWCWHFWSLP